MKHHSFHLFIALFLLTLTGCVQEPKYQTIEGFLEGTTYRITYADPNERDLQDTVESLVHRFERSLSIYDSTSLISQLNGNLTDSTDVWFRECFAIYTDIYTPCDSLLDPTLRPLIAIYGFGGKHSAPRSPSQSEIDSIKSFTGLWRSKLIGDRLAKSDPRIELDFNALAKGYSVDLVGRLLDSMGVDNYMIEIGGEIITRGLNPSGKVWRVGIDSPFEGNNTPGQDLQAILELSDRGLATSGNYRKEATDQNGNRVTHTIDPRTGRNVTHNLLSATILAPTCALADGYATACMVGGLEWSKKLISSNPDLDGILIYTDKDGKFCIFSTILFETK